jgi:hypothetical protein
MNRPFARIWLNSFASLPGMAAERDGFLHLTKFAVHMVSSANNARSLDLLFFMSERSDGEGVRLKRDGEQIYIFMRSRASILQVGNVSKLIQGNFGQNESRLNMHRASENFEGYPHGRRFCFTSCIF